MTDYTHIFIYKNNIYCVSFCTKALTKIISRFRCHYTRVSRRTYDGDNNNTIHNIQEYNDQCIVVIERPVKLLFILLY